MPSDLSHRSDSNAPRPKSISIPINDQIIQPIVNSKEFKINNPKNVSLFGIDLSHLTPLCQGIILTCIILFGFLLIGYVEEGFKFKFKNFSFGWFMTAVELIIFSFFAMIERLFKSLSKITAAVYSSSTSSIPNQCDQPIIETEHVGLINSSRDKDAIKKMKNNGDIASAKGSNLRMLFRVNWLNVIFEKQMSIKYHLIVASAMMCSRALTNIALLLLNYPTQVIFKSMKLISVMVGSVCCLKKQYHRCEYIAVPLLVGSAVLFTLGDANDLNFNVLGIIVVVVSLLFDAIHANSQQYILQAKTERDTTMELLVYSNLIAGVLAFVVSYCYGEISEIVNVYLPEQDDGVFHALSVWFVGRVACLYIGVSAFVVFTKRFGAVFAGSVAFVFCSFDCICLCVQ